MLYDINQDDPGLAESPFCIETKSTGGISGGVDTGISFKNIVEGVATLGKSATDLIKTVNAPTVAKTQAAATAQKSNDMLKTLAIATVVIVVGLVVIKKMRWA